MTTKRVIVFYASKTPNQNGDLNWYEEVKISRKEALGDLQKLVDGNVEILPHQNGYDAPFTGYANEEGLLRGLPRNDLAGGALTHLGFFTMSLPLGCAYAGNVVLLGKDDKSLSDKQIEQIKSAVEKYRKEWNNDDEEEDEEDEEDA